MIVFPPADAPSQMPALVFSPRAWLKLQFMCHAGDTEVGGFGISRSNQLLYVEDLLTVCQHASPVSVRFEDEAVADFFDRCVDNGLETQRFGRIWCHTHPGRCAQPSQTDEETFARVFGGCDWALMFILSRGGATYARLKFNAGPGGEIFLPVHVDWESLPGLFQDPLVSLDQWVAAWKQELAGNVRTMPFSLADLSRPDRLFPPLEPEFPFEPWRDEFQDWLNLREEIHDPVLF